MNSLLIPSAQWIEPYLDIADGKDLFRFHIQDAFNYHGYDAVGGVVLGFRLLQRLSYQFNTDRKPLQRREIGLFTAFPGLGARDCFELITRMVTDQRITVDTEFSDTTAQPGIYGRFYFQFSYQGQKLALAPIEGYPGAHFLKIGLASKQQNVTAHTMQQWQKAKCDLANTLLSNRTEDVIRIL
ncbi:hypothetical protein [Orbus mooreae]|uniref:hypothetical protein n=1 Tax=Orbus mooreae TaxID=3074107 RepID=UPI00370D8B7D